MEPRWFSEQMGKSKKEMKLEKIQERNPMA